MSKQIKQMEMDALRQTFQGIRDLVMMSITGQDCQADNRLRLGLRKKSIRMQVVKNSLARKVFDDLGMHFQGIWEGPTLLAWGGPSLADLCKDLDSAFSKNEKVKFKGAVVDGKQITFAQGLKMPTRMEAIGRVLMLALSPARRLAGQVLGPASRVAGQVKSLAEKAEPEKTETPSPAA